MTEHTRESLEIAFPLEVRHSETDDLYWVEDANGCTVCDLYIKVSEGKFHRFHNADLLAAFIVTAANSHHDLVEAKKLLDDLLSADDVWSCYGSGFRLHFSFGPRSNPDRDLEYRLFRARAALAKAKGGAS